MKIGVLNWRDAENSRAGGAEIFIDEVCKVWASQGHDVTLVTSMERGLPVHESRHGVEIHRIGNLNRGSHHARAPRFLRRIRPDVVLESINTIPYMLPTRRFGLPYLPLVHQLARDVWATELPRVLATVARAVEPNLYRPYRAVRTIAVSPSTARDLSDVGLREVTIVRQGGIGAQSTEPKEDRPTLIFVGRLTPNKRPDHAIAAFRIVKERIPDAALWIVGTGTLQQELERDLPPGAHLLGRVSQQELFTRMSRAHVLIATSIREGWGLVVTEANALGTPAISYDVPGLRDSINNGTTGVLTPPNPEPLAEAICRFLDDNATYWSTREAAIQWGSSFTWQGTADMLMSKLQSTAEAGQRMRS